ncbi:MAG: NADH-quinone oxidoreductase subunit L, partial [Opitutaceae bacterium]|nr:NADH-quinone oxidoreductase subunit L [Opitutaceae bacterium]
MSEPLPLLLALIPLLPLAAAALSAVTPRAGRRLSATLAIGSMAAALALSLIALATALASPADHTAFNATWFLVADTPLQLGLLLDPLTGLMLAMVTFVGLMIFVFSAGYMKDDPNFTRFFCFLALFASAMLGLIVANSLLLLFACWELVGLASYLLIGFWFDK